MTRITCLAAVAAAVTLAAGCGGSSTSTPSGSSPTPPASSTPSSGDTVAALALTAAEATQYGGQPVDPNPGVNTALGRGPGATLDLCDATFPSEALRAQRYQEFFTAAGDPHTVVESNEVVRYQPGGATKAYQELRSIARACSGTAKHGVRISKPTIVAPSTKFAHRQLTIVFSERHAGTTVYSAAVYQYQGDIFDGVYVFRGSRHDALTAALALGGYVAQKLAAGAPST